ncbi:MAG TPA: hypothetical protein VF177_20770 [Anaerolineae bacterium]
MNIGPLGGENSISAVIETVIARKKGHDVNFPLSKSDQFFVQQFTQSDPPDEMIEYRELNHAAQNEIIRRWGNQRLGVIWLGAGVFTLEHPLLEERKQRDWHVWTDASPRIVESALKRFNELHQHDQLGKLSRGITLPYDVEQLNQVIDFLAPNVSHIVIFGYGVTYALTARENYQWLSRLRLPENLDVSFVFNSPGAAIPLLPGVMAAFHQQRMVYYDSSDIAALFAAALPGSEIIWEIPREQTRNKLWGTWLILSPARTRQ